MYAKVFGIINIANSSFTGISAKDRKKNKNEKAKPIPVEESAFSSFFITGSAVSVTA